MNMGEKIYYLRTQKGLTLEELGNMVGVGKSTVRKWENGMIANMKRDKILKVSQALETSPAYLMGWKEEEESTPDRIYKTAPVITLLPDGLPARTVNLLPAEPNSLAVEADFCLIAAGDSMQGARICDGDLVWVQKQDWVENGEIAALVLNGEKKAVLRRLYYHKEKKLLILKPENSAYEDSIFVNEELEHVQILGKAVAFQSLIR